MNYSPSSYFFVDNTKLSDANIANWDTDAFGPQDVAESETYRTTSFVRSSELTKVFAVCNGQILIQPQTEDNTKVNLILKPDASESFYPLKIKYFIYRGVNKADLINGDNLQPENEADPNQPTFLKQIWKEFKIFNMPFFEKGIIEELPDTFPAFLIGYTEDEGTTSIEKYIRRTDSIEFYQLPYCKKGEHLGFFTGKIGLDIVLDYGDYELTNQEELFRLDLNFARKAEHVFDITTISDTTPTKVKRYKEYIHQFLDAAAFWGSHIDCGEIKGTGSSEKLTTNADIYTYILKKYQTKNKLYFYIQTERARSYNFYDSTRKIYGIDTTPISNETNGWPIIIKEKTFSSSNHSLKIGLDYYISRNIESLNRNVSLAVIASNHDLTVYPKTERKKGIFGYIGKAFAYDTTKLFNNETFVKFDKAPESSFPEGLKINDTTTGLITGTPTTHEEKEIKIWAYKTQNQASYEESVTIYINPIIETLSINFAINETKSCANFVFVFADIYQEYYPNEYYNNLWFVNLGSTFKIPDNEQNLIHWLNYDKNQVKNFDVIQKGEATIVQQKVVFDNGINQEAVGPNPPTKKRRTYITGIKSESVLKTQLFRSGFEKRILDSRVYSYRLFNDTSFVFYKGTFTDYQTQQTIQTLTLFNNDDYTKKFNYLLLGITEEEYNKLIYDNPTPTIEPPNTEPIQILPKDAANVFFYLEEDYLFITQNVKKFKLGLQYEDNAGVLQILYPSENNSVYVYTIDGYFFCSPEYTDYQHFYKKLPEIRADFRPGFKPEQSLYDGAFGFDYMRIGDTPIDGDVPYENNVGKQYYDETFEKVVLEGNESNKTFLEDIFMYNKLELDYTPIPIQQPLLVNTIEKYYVPTLNILPPYVPVPPPRVDLDRQQIFAPNFNDDINRKGELILIVKIGMVPLKIEFEYNADLIELTHAPIPLVTGEHNVPITINAKQALSKSVCIKVNAFNNSIDYDTIGLLIINSNSKEYRKSKKVILIRVQTNINGIDNDPEVVDSAASMMKFMRQQFITPVFKVFSLDMRTNIDFNNDYVYLYGGNNVLIVDNALVPSLEPLEMFLYERFKESKFPGTSTPIGTTYDDDIRVFYIDEKGGDIEDSGVYKPGLKGYSRGKNIVNFIDADMVTPAHELLHSLQIGHSFTAYESNPQAKFTYRPHATDNLMDYVLHDRTSLWNWQGNIARKNSDFEP